MVYNNNNNNNKDNTSPTLVQTMLLTFCFALEGFETRPNPMQSKSHSKQLHSKSYLLDVQSEQEMSMMSTPSRIIVLLHVCSWNEFICNHETGIMEIRGSS